MQAGVKPFTYTQYCYYLEYTLWAYYAVLKVTFARTLTIIDER